jgi:AraC family transcriptional regulator, regulatory protein of adaptative response / DNA-3-methyladenine glycosylase II
MCHAARVGRLLRKRCGSRDTRHESDRPIRQYFCLHVPLPISHETFGRPFSPAEHLTHLFPTPEALCDAELENLGILKAAADSIRAVARAACLGRITFDKIADTAGFLHALADCPGVGPQTVEYVAMRALRDTDAFPMTLSTLKRVLEAADLRAVQQRTSSWRPWRAYAAVYLSASLGAN